MSHDDLVFSLKRELSTNVYGYASILWNIHAPTPRDHAVLPLELSSVEELASAQQRMYELVVTRVRMKLSSSETNFDCLVGPLEWLANRGTWLAYSAARLTVTQQYNKKVGGSSNASKYVGVGVDRPPYGRPYVTVRSA
ncbi:hypothetical protein ACHAW6_008206 [Cyclotella cf. meneghiniana]